MTLESKLKEAIEEWLNSSELNNDTVDDLASELGERLRVDTDEALKMLCDNEYWVGKRVVEDAMHVEKKLCNADLAKALSTAPIITIGEKK